ncbi:MAG: undecaprenyldiphospho-muramoylpentapeptide beta-N-acetylglucosaminyltransferase [Eubacteriales bacterium]|nr:undecaprenyldiphospho-muramoylpentapeptide beta-N-acetylglucosaminyltransferase [Eubacteriales bacterium]
MNFLIACGGTSGHINPAIAIADELRRRDPGSKFLFVGTKRNLEAELVPRAGYEIRFIDVSGLSRDKTFEGLRHNMRTLRKFIDSKRMTKRLIDEFRPDVAIGTGGYVSAPVMRAACERHIPTVIHEQNAFAGVTTKMLAGSVDRILLSFKLAKPISGTEEKSRLVGNPVRNAFFELNRQTARKALGIPENEKVVLSCGGSLGATKLNEAFTGFAKKVASDGTMSLYHGASRDYRTVCEALNDIENKDRIHIFEYIYDMPQLMAASDLIVSRSGATSLTEIAALGRASILVPSPNVTENHQYFNAKTFSDAGAAILLEEKDLSPESLYDAVNGVVFDTDKLNTMERAAKSLCNEHAASDIADEIVALAEKHK